MLSLCKAKQLDQDREATRLSPQLEQIIFCSFKPLIIQEIQSQYYRLFIFRIYEKKFYLSVVSGRIPTRILWEKPLFHVMFGSEKIIQTWILSYKKAEFWHLDLFFACWYDKKGTSQQEHSLPLAFITHNTCHHSICKHFITHNTCHYSICKKRFEKGWNRLSLCICMLVSVSPSYIITFSYRYLLKINNLLII